MLQHSYTTTKKQVVVTNSSPESTLWLLRGLHMSDVTGLYVNAKHASPRAGYPAGSGDDTNFGPPLSTVHFGPPLSKIYFCRRGLVPKVFV